MAESINIIPSSLISFYYLPLTTYLKQAVKIFVEVELLLTKTQNIINSC